MEPPPKRLRMALRAGTRAQTSRCLLLELPTELVINVFSNVHSFADAFNLSYVNKFLHSVWTEHDDQIFETLVPRCIPCKEYALQTLVDSTGQQLQDPLSSEQKTGLLKNLKVVEEARFEFEISISLGYTNSYEADANRDLLEIEEGDGESGLSIYNPLNGTDTPKTKLTMGQRRRFIRTYYIMWSFLCLSESEWSARLQQMSLKQLYMLSMLAKFLKEPVQTTDQRWLGSGTLNPSYQASSRGVRTTSATLASEVWSHLQQLFQQLHGRDAPSAVLYAGVCPLWDCDQKRLRAICEGVSQDFWGHFEGFQGPRGDEKSMAWEESDDDDL
ncbi:MAG: hypothetical protein M1831_001382 [Alyxoria varia]|nr:MAG: hypothetical protein M1831_001382 [Alyxoria varia]